MQYILGNEFTAIEESTGTIANISTVPAEISTTPSRGTGIILYPRQVLYFNKNIYAARASGAIGTSVVAAISSSISSGGGGGGGETSDEEFFTPADVDKIFNDSDFTALASVTLDPVGILQTR